jgi:hypothetical protein
MRKHRILYYGLISLILIAIVSCSKVDLEQELTNASVDETYTRADLIEYTINVKTEGTLDSLLQAGSYSDAQKLILKGNIAFEDVNYVDVNMPSVEVLDLSETNYESSSIYRAFLSDSTKIKEISLPKNIYEISGKWDYYDDIYYSPFDCSSLTSITLPKNLRYIGDYAFWHCTSLTSINIPESVTSIGSYAFEYCRSLTSINIPESVTSIGSYAFFDCSSLTSINIPESVTSIGSYAFYWCSSLTSINIPESITSIEAGTFAGCSSLTSINIPEGVTSIGSYAFEYCSSLTSINIPESITSIKGETFYGCTSLTSISIPEGVTSIGIGAFEYCSSLTSITLPQGITSIEKRTFHGCTSLNITIPERIISIGEDALDGQKIIYNSPVDDLGDLWVSGNIYCWLIINRPDGNIPLYGPNWNNVVINGVAESVILPYKEKVDFSIPEEVKSIKKISYTMTFNENPSSWYGSWRTIALPFKPTHITHKEKGTLAPFNSGVEGAINFWLRELTVDGFKNVTEIEPNRPYIIAMPNSKRYIDRYNIGGDVTFSAENLTAEDFVNNTPLSAEGANYTMYASYSYMESAVGVYALNSYNQFASNACPVYPHEAYLKANTTTLRSVVSLNNGRAVTRAGDEGKREPRIDDM